MMPLIFGAALKGTVLLASAWLVAALLRKSSADLRHRVWLAALCGLPLLMIPLQVPEVARVEVAYTFYAGTLAPNADGVASGSMAWSTLVWAIGAAVVFLRFLLGLVTLVRLTRNARATELAGVRASAAISTPLTWGVFKPTILLPDYAADWSDEKRAMAVAHERAHIARGDWFWQSYALLLTAIFWFHPLVWFASARLRQEAEEAVDDAVVSSGAEAASYAEQLLEVARHMNGSTQVAAVAMVRYPALSLRVAAILDGTRVRTLAGIRSRVAIAVIAICSVPVLAAFQSVEPATVKLIAQAAPRPAQAPRVPAPTPIRVVPTSPAQNNGVTAPVVVFRTDPEYTEAARRAKYQGDVLISVVVDENGFPSGMKVTKALGLGLDENAIKAVREWRFKPGTKDGKPVAVEVQISVGFYLL